VHILTASVSERTLSVQSVHAGSGRGPARWRACLTIFRRLPVGRAGGV